MKVTQLDVDARKAPHLDFRVKRDDRLTGREVFSVDCDSCGEKTGDRCRNVGGWPVMFGHWARVEAAGRRLDQGEPEAIRHVVTEPSVWFSFVDRLVLKRMHATVTEKRAVELEHLLFAPEKTVTLIIDGERVENWEG